MNPSGSTSITIGMNCIFVDFIDMELANHSQTE